MPDLGIGALIAGLGAGASAIPAAVHAGKDNYKAGPNPVDPNAYQYGGISPEERAAQAAEAEAAQAGKELSTYPPGSPGWVAALERGAAAQRAAKAAREAAIAAGSMADQESARLLGASAAADARQGVQMNRGAFDKAGTVSNASRGDMAGAMGMLRDAAMGKGPSAAGAELQLGVDESNRNAHALASSSRGGALGRGEAMSQALAQQSHNTNAAVNQAAALRAREQQAGQAGYAQSAGALAGRDLQAQQLEGTMTTEQARLNDAQSGRNDARAGQYEGFRQNVRGQQLGASMAQAGLNQGGALAADLINSGISKGNAAADMANIKAAVGGTMGALESLKPGLPKKPDDPQGGAAP